MIYQNIKMEEVTQETDFEITSQLIHEPQRTQDK